MQSVVASNGLRGQPPRQAWERDALMNRECRYRSSGWPMAFFKRAVRVGLWAMLLTLAWSVRPALAQQYLITDLGPTNMYPESQGINESGQVVWTRGIQGE